MLNKLKKNNKKGFTLVELIVVLVILAILAALLIPALTGYIDKAKEKQVIAETRQVVMAAQTLADEKYALVDPDDGAGISLTYTDVTALAEVKGTITENSIIFSDKGVVTDLTYTAANGVECVYDNDESNGEYYKVTP